MAVCCSIDNSPSLNKQFLETYYTYYVSHTLVGTMEIKTIPSVEGL